ncbi:hypothetical protein Plec18167_000612 [Paecilomyces lecythidis]|uniref:Alpha-galactosidase n=1 Tax=Paecilomyces lecythidis TaxID=3004212 RepID=A0ABR3YEX7_9EURO
MRSLKQKLLAAALSASSILVVRASIENPTLLPTPPMGFNNWARFMCDLNETLFIDTADSMISKGLLDAGYDRINLDDCWMAHSRTRNGSLQWNETLFPHGLPWLGTYVQQRGFKFGIYEDSGNQTCGGYPGSYGYEELDAKTFASWGIDYLKLDGCNVYAKQGRTLEEEYKDRYGLWHRILSGMSSPLIFSESAPAYFTGSDNSTDWYTVMDWVPHYGELARHSDDILVYSGQGSAWDSIMVNYDYNTLLARYQRPGYFNDPDFLIPDHPGLSMDEKRSHFALWASFSAPLIISAYIPGFKGDDIAFLTNKEFIKVDQDPMAQQATLVSRDETFDVLTRSLANGDRLLTVLNRGNGTASASVNVERLGLKGGCTYTAKDLWNGSLIKIRESVEIADLPSHTTTVYRISVPQRCSSVVPTGMLFNTASKNCLTATTHGTVTFEACNGYDSQVWQVNSSGKINSLAVRSECLTARGNSVLLTPCQKTKSQVWSYSVTGNLRNAALDSCLTEAGPGVSVCGFEKDGQVFGLPSGVVVDE